MIRTIAFTLFMATYCFPLLARGGSTQTAEKLIDIYVKGWQESNGQEFAKPFSDNAQFVNIFGMHFNGKKEIASRHQAIFDNFLAGTKFEVENIKTKEIRPDLLIAHVIWNLSNFRKSPCNTSKENSLRCPRRGIFNHVIIKQTNGNWEIIETQNTLIQDPPSKRSQKTN